MEASQAAGTRGLDDPVEPSEEVQEKTLSLADQIEARRRQLSEERKPLDLPLPGYGDLLIARYRSLDHDELKDIAKGQREMVARRDNNAELKMMCDTLSRACVGIFTTRKGELVALEEADLPELEGFQGVVRYDRNLAKVARLAFETDERVSARKIIRRLFVEDVSLIAHYSDVDTWMTSAREEDDDGF
jgi:hypothetical protein